MPLLVLHRASFMSGSRHSQSRAKLRHPHAAAQRRSDTFSSNRLLGSSGQSKTRRAKNLSAPRESRGAAVRGQQLGHANPPRSIFGYLRAKQSEAFVRLETFARGDELDLRRVVVGFRMQAAIPQGC